MIYPLTHRWFQVHLYEQARTVPDDIGEFATRFCKLFDVKGICDPLYICNVVAHESRRGDGCGKFATQPDYDEEYLTVGYLDAAKRLSSAYCACIKNKAGLEEEAAGEKIFSLMEETIAFNNVQSSGGVS